MLLLGVGLWGWASPELFEGHPLWADGHHWWDGGEMGAMYIVQVCVLLGMAAPPSAATGPHIPRAPLSLGPAHHSEPRGHTQKFPIKVGRGAGRGHRAAHFQEGHGTCHGVCPRPSSLFVFGFTPDPFLHPSGVHLILIGGFVQLLAGFLAFRKYDHLGGAAFLTFSALWSSYGVTRVLSAVYPSPENTTLPFGNASQLPAMGTALPSASQSAVAGLVAYIAISFILAFCSATVNYIMPFIFGAIALALSFEAVALFGDWALVVSAVLELGIVLCGLYGAVALLLKGVTQRYVLPGFGHPLFNILLLGSAQKSSSKALGEEKKKNTKYAEPMALGNICDTVSPFIFAFYFFGYVKTFCVGAAWISIISSCQLLSSFYSYLRGDGYHTTKFGVHSLLWLVMSWEEFVLSTFLGLPAAQESRLGMFGAWFFLATACLLFLMSTHKDTLEMLQNASFILLTSAFVHQIPLPGARPFLGAACSLCTALSLYASFASLINSIGEKVLVPVGPQAVSSSALQAVLGAARARLSRSQDVPSSTGATVPDALFYICNGLAAAAAIQGSVGDPGRQQLSVPSVLIPGALGQLFVCRIQVQGGKRFGSVLPFCYAAFWAAWTWLRLAGKGRDGSWFEGCSQGISNCFLQQNSFFQDSQ